MSKIYSPKIVTDSLVMCLDASQNKSYPTDLPLKDQLNLWLDAADDTTFSYSSGTTVSQWRDKSGRNNHAIVMAGSPLRSVAINSRKAVSFTSTSWFKCTTGAFASNATHFLVCRATTSSATYQRVYNGGNDGYLFFGALANNIATFWGTLSSGWIDTNVNSPSITILNTLRIISAINNGSTGTPYYDGTAMSTKTTTNSFAYTGYELNSYSNGILSQPLIGEVCEIIVFNKQLSLTELKQVHTYLGQKWGISNTDRSIVDLSNNNNHGLLGNGTTADMPLFDVYNKGALKFDGSSDYLSVADNVALNPVTVTVSMWLKRNAYQSSICNFLRRNDRDAYALMATNNTDTVWFRIRNSLAAVVDATTTMPLNTWTNLVGTFDGSNVRIYKDGVLANTTANTSAISYSGSTIGDLIIARDDIVSGRYAPINVGSTLIYSKALSAAEISQNYEAQKSKFTNTIVQQGLVLNLDADNIYSYGGAGTTVYDVSQTALSWTTNNITYNSDPIKYFSYNGSSSWLQSSTSAAYDSQTITMECWFYPATLTQDGFLFEKGQVNTQYSMFLAFGNTFYFRTIGGTINNQDTTFTSSNYLTANAWNHVVCTYNGSTKIIYANGVQATSVNASGTLQTGQTNQYIGKYGAAANNFPFNGRIAQTRVYNIALSATQVLQNYNATKGVFGL
jgi:hypothetical protein